MAAASGIPDQTFMLRDSSYIYDDSTPIEDSIIVHISPSELNTKEILFSGQLQALRDGLEKKSGELEILRFETCKFGVLFLEPSYLLALSGTLSEPDETLLASLKFLVEAFCFYHGSFAMIKDSVQADRKRFSNLMTRIWSSLLAYFRTAGDTVFASFTYVPYFDYTKSSNKLFLRSSQLLERAQRRDGVFGGCVMHKQSVLCSQLDADFTLFLLALVQPSHSSNHVEENNRRSHRFGARLRDQMLRSEKKYIRDCEVRLQIHPHCFSGRDFVQFMKDTQGYSEGEARDFGGVLLQAGVIRSILNEPNFVDDPTKYFRFRADDPAPSKATAAAAAAATTSEKERPRQAPLSLSWHGRDARSAQAARHISLPEGVFVLRVFVEPESLESLRQHTPWRNRQVRWVSVDSLEAEEATRVRTDSVSSSTHSTHADDMTGMRGAPAGDGDLGFADHLATLRLDSFRDFLVAKGLATTAALDAKLASLSSMGALERFVATYSGPDRHRLLANLAHASKVIAKDGEYPGGRIPACLYLQGVGDTAVGLLLETSRWSDQEFLQSLAELLARDVAQLDRGLTSLGEEAPTQIETYNFLTFNRCTSAIRGWCNRNMPRCDAWERLQPNNESDRVFVDSVADMHAQFVSSTHPHSTVAADEDIPTAEMILAKPGAPPVYGCRMFSQEVFVQASQSQAVDPKAAPKLFDDSVTRVAQAARDLLQKHGVHYLI
eukprot:m.7271 g.7271  ORF g.7271 m.7271 type:complete len:720 (-) comp2178_c0_seq1:77-2236(-)